MGLSLTLSAILPLLLLLKGSEVECVGNRLIFTKQGPSLSRGNYKELGFRSAARTLVDN